MPLKHILAREDKLGELLHLTYMLFTKHVDLNLISVSYFGATVT